MRYLRFALPVLLFFAFLARNAFGMEGEIPAISIPPAAQYLAQSVHSKFAKYCGERPACLPPLGFDTGRGEGRILSFKRAAIGAPLKIIEEAGLIFARNDGGAIIVRTSRKTITLSPVGAVVGMREEFSNDDFETVSSTGELSWDTAVDLLDAVEQFLNSVIENDERMRRLEGKEA